QIADGLGSERSALRDVDTERRIAFAKGAADVGAADGHAVVLKTAELVDRAAEVKREPPTRPQPALTEQRAVAHEIAAEVGERCPRDLVRDASARVEPADIGKSREIDVDEEVTRDRTRVGGHREIENGEAGH